jgi:hypothetical protein
VLIAVAVLRPSVNDYVTYAFDGGISGDYIVGHMSRTDSFAGRTCSREVTFRLVRKRR